MISMSEQTFLIQPVGYLKSPFSEEDPGFAKSFEDPVQRKNELKVRQKKIRDTICTIHILPQYEPLLDGISSFSHILVIFWPHLLQETDRHKKRVHPRGWKDLPQQGIFATRSPARPNPVLITTAELIRQEGCFLSIRGLDVFNNTSVIDIKPVITSPEPLKGFRVPDWIRQSH